MFPAPIHTSQFAMRRRAMGDVLVARESIYMLATLSPTDGECARGEVTFKIAASWEEREAAFRLLYDSYLRSGLGTPNPTGLRVTPYHPLPTTETFIAVVDDVVIATMSLVIDGVLGMPMESIFYDEVAARRDAGLRLAEVTCLADRRSQPRRFMPVMIGLSRLMSQFARSRRVDELLVAVHPSHARFYRRYLNFEPISDERAYPLVCHNPALALSLNFARIDEHRPDCYDHMTEPLPPTAFERAPMSDVEIAYFARVATACT